MASELSAEIQQKILECGICYETYESPKALPCTHAFCEACLEGYVTSIGARISFPCPTCRHDTAIPRGVKGLPRHFILGHLQEILERQGNQGDSVFCSVHKNEKIKFYCTEDHKAICRDCIPTTHGTHECIDIAEAGKQYRDQLKTALTDIKKELKLVHDTKKGVLKYQDRCVKIKDKAINEAKARADELKKEIDKLCQNAITHVNTEFVKTLQQITEKITSLNHRLDSLTASQELAHQLFEHGRDADLVELTQQIQQNVETTKQNRPPDLETIFNLEFCYNREDQHLASKFGEMKVKTFCYNREDQHLASKFGEMKMKTQLKNYSKVKNTKTFDGNQYQLSGLGIMHDKLVVSDHYTKSPRIFSSDGQLTAECTPDAQHPFNVPSGVTILPDNTIAIPDFSAHDIKLFTSQGKFIKTILDGKEKPWALAVNSKGHYIVGEWEKVNIYDQNEQFLLSLPSKFSVSKWNDVCVNSDDDIIVSDCNNHCIKVFNSTGTLLHQYGTKGSGDNQFNRPEGVCTDWFDNILIADFGNSRIHLLGPDGTFKHFVVTSKDGLIYPVSVAINQDGDLVVGEYGGTVKTFCF